VSDRSVLVRLPVAGAVNDEAISSIRIGTSPVVLQQ